MARKNALNNNDSMDINELAALDTEITPELIDQLHKKLSEQIQTPEEIADFDVNNDATLFEEPKTEEVTDTVDEQIVDIPVAETVDPEPQIEQTELSANIDSGYDDDFMKKYRAKLNAQNSPSSEQAAVEEPEQANEEDENDINKITNGSITEKSITEKQKEYNDSLDLLDGNVKYSKYVIYIDPQNVDFIDSLTVKERKNLINNILKEQNEVGMTRKKFRMVQAIIRHSIIAILTIAISIPIIYWTINASLEASINNYRRSQTNFEALYREKGKINIKQPASN